MGGVQSLKCLLAAEQVPHVLESFDRILHSKVLVLCVRGSQPNRILAVQFVTWMTSVTRSLKEHLMLRRESLNLFSESVELALSFSYGSPCLLRIRIALAS